MTLFLLLAACDNLKPGDSGPGGDDSGPSTCIDTNEDCAPGTCGGEGSRMLPGANCLACHSARLAKEEEEEDEDAPIFSIGGTAFSDYDGTSALNGATVRVTDSRGSVVTLTSNDVGNFYSRESMVPPLTAEIEVDGETRSMSREVSTGACNSCHACDGEAGGKLTGP